MFDERPLENWRERETKTCRERGKHVSGKNDFIINMLPDDVRVEEKTEGKHRWIDPRLWALRPINALHLRFLHILFLGENMIDEH